MNPLDDVSPSRQLTLDDALPPPLRSRVYSEPDGEKARERALDRVEENAGVNWMARALAAIARVAAKRDEFTSDDLWQLVGDPPNDPRALGAALRAAARAGLCESTDRVVKSARVACHRRPITVWRSRVRP